MGRRLRFALLYGIYLLAFLAAFHYVFVWRPYMNARRDSKEAGRRGESYLDPAVWRHLGSLRPDKQSSFVRFAPAKPPGVVRVCAFGDSFTHGDEVDESHDYPTLLQQLFDQRGPAHVEVLNFGNGWYGFHQSYIMWDLVGRRFGCDYVLLGPLGFFRERDVTFNHTDLAQPYYLHSRFILDGDDVRLIPVIGDTAQERFDHYFRFIPHWQYLRYDRNPPPVVVAALPKGRTVPNPFYYYPGPVADETLATYRILLRKLAASGSHIVLLQGEDAIVDIAEQVQMPNLVGSKRLELYGFPYVAPRGHYSAWGNQVIAEQFYAHLTGQPDSTVAVLQTSDAWHDATGATAGNAPDVSSYDGIDVRVDNVPVGVFVTPRRESDLTGGEGNAGSLKSGRNVSLLAIKDRKASLLNACFLPLDFALQPNVDVVLSVQGLGTPDRYVLGTVRRIAAGVNIGLVEVDGLEVDAQQRLAFRGNPGVSEEQLAKTGGNFSVLIGDHTILKGSRGGDRIVYSPLNGDFRRIRAGEYGFASLDTLDTSGDINLVLKHPRQGVTRIPIARWTKREVPLPHLARPLDAPLSVPVPGQ